MGAFAHKLPERELTLAELIDRAALAHVRFRECRCRDDCPHDGAALDADDALKAHLRDKLGLSADHINELGGLL